MSEVDELLSGIDDMEVIEKSPIQEKKEQFFASKDEEEFVNILDYAKIHLDYELDIQDIKVKQKENKDDAKLKGVSVTKVNKVIRELKAQAKETGEDVSELNIIEKTLNSDVDLQAMINNLVKKK